MVGNLNEVTVVPEMYLAGVSNIVQHRKQFHIVVSGWKNYNVYMHFFDRFDNHDDQLETIYVMIAYLAHLVLLINCLSGLGLETF